ncbi:MAG: hypothetical protein WCJ22_05560 [Actinomycetes bacterium]|jgi:phosphotransferase system  glucose/maltose/N-acetylglucosamine-specific IIC component
MTTLQQALVAPFTRARNVAVDREQVDNRGFLAILIVAALVSAGLLLALNSALTAGAFEVQTLQHHSADLQRAQQAIGQTVSIEQSPARLAGRAAALGMIPAKNPTFLVVHSNAAATTKP